MSDEFLIVPYRVRAAGTDVPPEEVQAAINSLAQQVTIALNDLDTGAAPSGPAGGDLGGTYPNPTVVALHVTSGTESGVAITGDTIDSSPIGATTPSTGAFTTLTATTPVGVASGGTGQNALSAHNVLIGEGTGAVGFAAPGAAGQMLISAGAAVDPAFANNPTITGGSINSTPVGATTPSTGAFTTLTATTPVGVASGGTGRATLLAHGVLVGEGTAGINQLAVGNTGQMLLGSSGADPGFGNNPTITGGTIDSTPVGATTPSTGAFTTLSSTGNLTPSQTNGIVGTTTNNNANAGSVGEFVQSSIAVGSAVALSTGVAANVTSISLTAGDWDVWGNIVTNPAGTTTQSQLIGSISTTSATQATAPAGGAFGLFPFTVAAGVGEAMPGLFQRLSLSTTTTVFLVATSNFAVSTNAAYGAIQARRRR